MKYKNLLKETIGNIVNSFNENELAYLAITSKIENPLRDKIAYKLHEQLNDKIICREWKDASNPENKNRYDLAILDKNEKHVECLVEFKAHSLQRQETGYILYELNKDLNRLEKFRQTEIEKYFVLFQNLPHSKFDVDFSSAIKYFQEMNNYFEKNNMTVELIRNNYHSWWENSIIGNKLNPLDENKVEKFTIETGSCYGVKIDIEGFIYGPI